MSVLLQYLMMIQINEGKGQLIKSVPFLEALLQSTGAISLSYINHIMWDYYQESFLSNISLAIKLQVLKSTPFLRKLSIIHWGYIFVIYQKSYVRLLPGNL